MVTVQTLIGGILLHHTFLNDFCVVAVDLSGNGESDHRENYSQEIYAKELKAVCDDRGMEIRLLL